MSPTYEPSSFELPEISTYVPSVSAATDIAACPSSLTADDPSALPSPTSSPPQSVTLLASSLDGSPCVPTVGLYCTFQGAVL